MLEDQVAYFLQRYLGNYVRGLSREALKISVWQGNVELTNMQLKPEALNALKLPVKVKAGFLGSVKIKVPWSRLGQDPVLVSLDQIFLLAEPATHVEGCSKDAVQEAKRSRVREMETRLLEKVQQMNSKMNKSWLGSFIDTIIGNLKLSISNIHIRYEDLESNPGHPFAAGLTLEKLSAITVDDNGKEIFATGGALEHIQKSVELEELSVYLDSDISPWYIGKLWEELLPSEWGQIFKFGTKDGKPADNILNEHSYILQPVTGNAKYSKLWSSSSIANQPVQKAAVNLDDVTLCLSKDGYGNILKLADNFAAFNQRMKYAHYRPCGSVKSSPRSWWKYAYKVISDQMKKESGKFSWEQVLRYASLRKRYISLYASLLKSDPSRTVVDDNKDIAEIDRELDIDLILQWRMLTHKFVDQSLESKVNLRKQKAKKSWWSVGWGNQSYKDENEPLQFSEEDWERLNKIIGYKDDDNEMTIITDNKGDVLHTSLDIHIRHNASKLFTGLRDCLAELSCESLDCSIRLYSEAKVFDVKLGSYKLSSPSGLLAESATARDSLVGVFCYKPFDAKVDWSLVAKASPCYMTYLKDSVDRIVNFFGSQPAVSQTVALEAAAAVQMTIDGVKRTAQEQVNKALKDHARFLLDLDIAAPKISIPTDIRPDHVHTTKLMLDLGNLVIRTQDEGSNEEMNLYLQFDLVLSDVSAFLVDGDFHWSQTCFIWSKSSSVRGVSLLPVIDKCGVILKLQQIRLENPSFPSTRLSMRLPSLGFHFSPARYHRLMQIAKIFQDSDTGEADTNHPWTQADFEGWLSFLSRKGVGNREAVWKKRYVCLVGPFVYMLESPSSKSYKQYISLRGKQIYQVPADLVGGMENVFAISDASRSNSKVVEDASALILRCDSDESRKIWQSRLQGAIYRASGSVPINNLAEDSSDSEAKHVNVHGAIDASETEKVFITGVLDEFKICFNYNHQSDQKAVNVLLEDEKHLFEFRAVGGQVELLIKGKDMFIGTVLKSLEIDDLVSCSRASHPCYLARSFIGSENAPSFSNDPGIQSQDSNDLSQNEGDEFYEAEENLVESVDYPSAISSLKPPSFNRVTNLLPDGSGRKEGVELSDALDSFVKAQIVICDQNSPSYNKMDTQVIVTLAKLSFFCRRPTILAIMEFVNALDTDDKKRESFSDNSSLTILKEELTREDIDGQCSAGVEEPVFKSLLGKGKSRIIFNLSLHMTRAQIALMNENETELATLSQDNLLTDIKVYPSSFSIKASLGNLRISDDSLSENHIYFWACDMRNPGGSSFVELIFSSYNIDDEDYKGYEYSLLGQLSEVRIVYLNRFVQEVVSYFMSLVPNDSKGVVKLKDQVTNSEKWFTTGEIEGSPAVKLDVSLRKPIIVMPQRTDSLNYLKLDIVHITIQNTFQWFGSKSEMNAVNVDIMTITVEDINLNVGTGSELGQSIIEDVKGVSIVVQRSLRDLLHQIPSIEVAVNIEQLKASLSNREYQIITDCTLSNIAETPHVVPPLDIAFSAYSVDAIEPASPQNYLGESETQNEEAWIDMEVSVNVNLVQLGLHSGKERDASLAILQIRQAWLLYKSNSLKDGFLSATLKSLTVIDDREGTEEEFRLAVGNSENWLATDDSQNMEISKAKEKMPIPTLLILDVKFTKFLTSISICIQRPQLLVALDFLLAVVEFFVPSIGGALPNHDDESSLHVIDAIILDKETYTQPSAEIALSPQKPLVADDDRFDLFIYDGGGGTLYLQDRQGSDLTAPSKEAIIFVGTGKRLEFRNVVIKNGHFLDSCILLGTDSSYSASKDDNVLLDEGNKGHLKQSTEFASNVRSSSAAVDWATELIVELQAIGPELTFYNRSREIGESATLSNKLLHAQLDAFCRLVLKGDKIEMNGNALGLTMESNGVRIIEPFDTSLKFSNASGKTNIHVDVSNIFMNFSFSILRLFLAVEEDILAFLRRTSKKLTIVCSQFDKVGTIQNLRTEQIYAFWRPHAPPGFSALGDYLTPLDKPPSKGVVVVNTSLVGVKKPVSFKLIWAATDASGSHGAHTEGYSGCSIWLPEAPKGYFSLGCVVSQGRAQPPLTSVFCISASLVSPCTLRDCITISFSDVNLSTLAFWRVDNSMGTFLPADVTLNLAAKAYELRHIFFGFSEATANVSETSEVKNQQSGPVEILHSDGSTAVCTGQYFEAVASFQLIWWNEGSSSRKKLSIWRPVVPQGMVYFGDIAVQGYEPPNTCFVLRDIGDDEILKAPIDFQLVGQIKKQKRIESISLWNPQAPPGFVSLGCIACKGTPKQYDLSGLRCIRSDMVTGVHFDEESVWDTSDAKSATGPFSLWTVGNALGTFIVRSGLKKPPKRFALKIVDPNMPSGTDDTVIDAEIGTFSVAVFDDYGGLMVPLFNVSLSSVGFSLHGRPDNLNSAVSFSLSARSYNDKYEAWEPLVEPMDGFLRYQYNLNAPDAASQLLITATRDLNLNISVSNANMIIQAYASWNNLSRVHNPYREREAFSPIHSGRSIIDIHHKKNYYIIPQNRLGQDIFIRPTEIRGLRSIVKMPSGDMKPVKVPVSKDMLDSHLRGNLRQSLRTMVTVIIRDAQFLRVEGLASHQYTVAVRLNPDTSVYGEPLLNQQSARTCGSMSDSSDTELISVNWSEVFFFKVDSVEHYVLEMIVTDIGKGAPVGFFSAPLRQIARKIDDSLASDYLKELAWIELCSAESEITSQDRLKNQNAKIRCAVILSPHNEVEEGRQSLAGETKSGFLQISPSKEGPWTTVSLNYAAPAACWRLGNNVVASEVIVNDCNRYVNIRSLVSIRNTTIFTIDVCLKPKSLGEVVDDRASRSGEEAARYVTDEYFETESYNPDVGSWSGSLVQSKEGDDTEGAKRQRVSVQVELPTGWEWVDDWHLDASSVSIPEGWVYAPNVENLKWSESSDPLKSVNYARQRRWIRNRKLVSSVVNQWISVGILKPGDTLPLPLSGLAHSGLHVLKLRPSNSDHPDEFSWSSVVDKPGQPKNSGDTTQDSEICVSSLTETDELLFCSKTSGTSSNCSRGLWFSINVQATEIAKDIHSDPIQDWCLVVKSPLSITNFLPFAAEFAILEEQTGGHFIECSRGIFAAGESVKVYSADMRKQLYLSLLPQRGWLPIHEAVLISDPNQTPSKSVSLRSSVSGRIVQILIEQNNNKERPASEKIIRVYAPYWLSVARCPPLTYRLIDMSGEKQRRKIPSSFQSKINTGTMFEEITDEEIYEGYTIASVLNFKLLGLAVAVTDSGSEQFTDIRDLSPLGDMDGSLDINAYDADGHRMRLFISSKPCPYQSVPTKVISVRPYMTFTNRAGEHIFVKMSAEDDPKILHASDSRVSFLYRQTSGSDKLQVKLGDTKWSFPIEIVKEDTIYLVLRKDDGKRRFLRTEIRGYEEGSRFIVVFRLGSTKGPIRFENRTIGKTICIRQSGFGDDVWIKLEPLSTTNFSWEDPYGHKLINVKVCSCGSVSTGILDLEKDLFSSLEGSCGLKFHAVDVDDIKVARFTDENMNSGASSHDETMTLAGNWGNSRVPTKIQSNVTPLEIIIELGVFGVSLVDHRPKELSYLYLERVFMSYSTGYDGGTTSRFKLILGHLQLDNQLPLTLMPVLLAPEQNTDGQQPVFKITLTMRNENADGIQATERCWRLSIHEPIIWALVNFYNNLQLDRIPQSSNVTQVDPEIRVDLIDVSEVRLKVALETAPAQRPHGVLGVWSPILSAIGNAFKIQVHLRKVMHRDRFMRKSSVLPAIGNRIFRDLIHNPLHLIFSVDVLGMTSSTLASLSKGLAELSTDGQFMQLRTKQVWSRKITGVGDGIIQGTEALAQGVAFGVSGVVRKPVESARQNGLFGLAHGLGQAFLGFIVQPVSGALDFFSLTVDGIGASCTRCLDIFNNKTTVEIIRNPRAIRASGVLTEYCEREALGQMVLYLAEASRHFGCTEIFKEPSKFAWSDFYEDHFVVPYHRIVLVTSRRVMLLQCIAPEKMDKRPCKIMWDVPWEELMALELAKAGSQRPSHLILHLKTFRRSEIFVRVIKCSAEEESDGREPQAVKICSVVCRMWKAYQADMKSLILKVPSSQRQVYLAWSIADERDSRSQNKSIIRTRDFSSFSSSSDLTRFVRHSINFSKIWSSEQESRGRCTLCLKQVQSDVICSIWRPICPEGYVSIGDIAHVGSHPPNVAAVYRYSDKLFTPPVGYDLVWRNCSDDYASAVSIWLPRAPDGYISCGCVAVADFHEPEPDLVYCLVESLAQETVFEDQKIWSTPASYPWGCHLYQVRSDALHFISLRQTKEESDWKPMRVMDDTELQSQEQASGSG